jgi:hypothetical protein
MSYYEIRPINRSCGSYGPGHQMHWIQAKKPWEGEQPMIDVSIVVHHDGRVDIEGDELTLTMWNHDAERLRDAVDYRGRGRAAWKPRLHVLAVPGPSGYLFNLAALDERTPCHPGARQAPGESTPDFLARTIREDHGFTVPGRSLLAPDVVECQPKNTSRLMAMRLAAIARLSHPFCGERVTVFLAPSWCTSAVAKSTGRDNGPEIVPRMGSRHCWI